MKILVCGGRNYSDAKFLFSYLDKHFSHATEVITGAQRWPRPNGTFIGADWLAIEWAISRQINFRGFPAKWNREGDQAGFLRNSDMLAAVGVDQCVAFPGNNGTRDMISKCQDANIPFTFAGW